MTDLARMLWDIATVSTRLGTRTYRDPDYDDAMEKAQRTTDIPPSWPPRYVCADCYVGDHHRCDGRRGNGAPCECSRCGRRGNDDIA